MKLLNKIVGVVHVFLIGIILQKEFMDELNPNRLRGWFEE